MNFWVNFTYYQIYMIFLLKKNSESLLFPAFYFLFWTKLKRGGWIINFRKALADGKQIILVHESQKAKLIFP